jgi:hypothetical protein
MKAIPALLTKSSRFANTIFSPFSTSPSFTATRHLRVPTAPLTDRDTIFSREDSTIDGQKPSSSPCIAFTELLDQGPSLAVSTAICGLTGIGEYGEDANPEMVPYTSQLVQPDPIDMEWPGFSHCHRRALLF